MDVFYCYNASEYICVSNFITQNVMHITNNNKDFDEKTSKYLNGGVIQGDITNGKCEKKCRHIKLRHFLKLCQLPKTVKSFTHAKKKTF